MVRHIGTSPPGAGYRCMREPLPHAGSDLTIALMRDPYGFIGHHCDRLGTDGFRTRIALRPAICLRGAEAAAFFYTGGRFSRARAMPPITVRLLQDKGSVQTLNGAVHRHRKAMFMDIAVAPGAVNALEQKFAKAWDEAEARWLAKGEARLLPEVNLILARAAVEWMGFDWTELGGQRFARDLDAMVANAAGFGPRAWAALIRRRRAERAVKDQIRTIRREHHPTLNENAARKVAFSRDETGNLLSLEVAAVEALNLLRPILAIGRFIVDAAQAFEREPALKARLINDPFLVEGFVEEVRRMARFFPVVGGTAMRDLDWRGSPVPKGSWVILALWGTSNDPRAVPEPSRIEPARATSWREQGHQIIPQGAGQASDTHRCPGEWITVALMAEATRRLLRLRWRVDPAAMTSPPFRYPPSPRDGFLMQDLVRD